MSEFTDHREEVRNFIASGMMDQGATAEQACVETICVMFWDPNDVENLYRCINSNLGINVIKAIVAHDYNGLSRGDIGFLPKSTQFAKEKENALSN
jgi:hypothetical protein